MADSIFYDPGAGSGGGGGTGSVTTVSVTTANGVSGSVANPTTTPAITLALGAITPSSVAASGAVSGSNLSGTNTGDQTNITGNAGTATALQTGRAIDGQAFDGTADITVIAPGTHAAASKATPVDADELPLVDSAASNVLKKLTWTNLKAAAKAYFDTLYLTIAAATSGYATLQANTFTDCQTFTTGTKAVSTPILKGTQTWNGVAVSFDADLITITNTTSNPNSYLTRRVSAGVTQFSVSQGGAVVANQSYLTTTGFVGIQDGTGFNGQLALGSGGALTWGTTVGAFSTPGTYITQPSAAIVQLGAPAAAGPIAQTLQAQGARPGTDSNVGGANMTVQAGTGTGTGTLSSLLLKTPIAVASGTGAQTQTTGLKILNGTAVLTNYAVASLPSASVAGAGATAFVTDGSTTLILGLGLAVAGGGANKVPVYSDGTNWIVG